MAALGAKREPSAWYSLPVAPGQTVSFNINSDEIPFSAPTDFRLTPATRRLVPLEDFTYSLPHHSSWLNWNFSHGVEVTNISNRMITDWEIYLAITGSMNIETASNAAVVQNTSTSALLVYIPGHGNPGQPWFPGQVSHNTIGGTGVEGSYVSSLRLYEYVAVAYGGWPDFVTPGDTPHYLILPPPQLITCRRMF